MPEFYTLQKLRLFLFKCRSIIKYTHTHISNEHIGTSITLWKNNWVRGNLFSLSFPFDKEWYENAL